MGNLFTTSNIMFALGIIGILFSVYSYFRNPQEKLALDQALTKKDVESEAALLAQEVKLKNEQNDKKVTELAARLDGAMTLAQNHIHTVDTKVDGVITQISLMSNEITMLRTIIEERMPRKSSK